MDECVRATAETSEDDRRQFERYTAAELRALLTDAGFAMVEQRPSDRWVYVAAEV